MSMKPNLPKSNNAEPRDAGWDQIISLQSQEIECALILSQMINKVADDPSQMRLAIYEFARARLQIDTSWADEVEKQRFAAALERAIEGVEAFSVRQEERERLQPSATSSLLSLQNGLVGTSPASLATYGSGVTSEWQADPSLRPWEIESQPVVHMRSPTVCPPWQDLDWVP